MECCYTRTLREFEFGTTAECRLINARFSAKLALQPLPRNGDLYDCDGTEYLLEYLTFSYRVKCPRRKNSELGAYDPVEARSWLDYVLPLRAYEHELSMMQVNLVTVSSGLSFPTNSATSALLIVIQR